MSVRKISYGFTLLEVVVSLGILAVLSLILSQSFISSIRTSTKGEVSQEVLTSGNYAIELASRLILNANDITSACTSTGASSSEITIKGTDSVLTTLGCVVDTTSLRIASTSGSTVTYLTSDAVTLNGEDCSDAITFVCKVVGSENKKNVTMSFDLEQRNPFVKKFEKAKVPFIVSMTMRN